MNPVLPCYFRELQPIFPAILPEWQLFALLSVFRPSTLPPQRRSPEQ
ncbi:hypothetical protein ECN1_4781 [Escherichia coli N1]|nr:hypothetical protein ECN1_4781 [Escherichia coli N1]